MRKNMFIKFHSMGQALLDKRTNFSSDKRKTRNISKTIKPNFFATPYVGGDGPGDL